MTNYFYESYILRRTFLKNYRKFQKYRDFSFKRIKFERFLLYKSSHDEHLNRRAISLWNDNISKDNIIKFLIKTEIMKHYPSTATIPTGLPPRTVDFSKLVDKDYNNHHHPRGKDMFGRTKPFNNWIKNLKSSNLFLYSRRTLSPPGPECYG